MKSSDKARILLYRAAGFVLDLGSNAGKDYDDTDGANPFGPGRNVSLRNFLCFLKSLSRHYCRCGDMHANVRDSSYPGPPMVRGPFTSVLTCRPLSSDLCC